MTRRTDPNHKFFKRLCKRCDKIFQPQTKYNLICPECLKESGRWREKYLIHPKIGDKK